MTEREFELYLDLLGRLMRLSPRQREAVASELRDHLEERFEELLTQGLSRHEAVAQALAELGEAHHLAREFSHLALQRRRRLIMRCTLATALVLAVGLSLAVALWPQSQPQLAPRDAVAQQNQQSQPVGQATSRARRPGALTAARFVREFRRQEELRERIEEKLQQEMQGDLPKEMNLSTFCRTLEDLLQIKIVLDHMRLEEQGVEPDTPVQSVDVQGLTFKEVLRLVLRPLGLDFRVAAGYVLVSSRDEIYDSPQEIRLYDVSELAADRVQLEELAMLVPRLVSPDFWSPTSSFVQEKALIVQRTLAGMSGGTGGAQAVPEQKRRGTGHAPSLYARGAIIPWQDRYLIVRASYPVQEQVALFLEQLRFVTQRP